MSILDFVLIALVLGAAICSIIYSRNQKKKGNSCCGNCSGCSASCASGAKKEGL